MVPGPWRLSWGGLGFRSIPLLPQIARCACRTLQILPLGSLQGVSRLLRRTCAPTDMHVCVCTYGLFQSRWSLYLHKKLYGAMKLHNESLYDRVCSFTPARYVLQLTARLLLCLWPLLSIFIAVMFLSKVLLLLIMTSSSIILGDFFVPQVTPFPVSGCRDAISCYTV